MFLFLWQNRTVFPELLYSWIDSYNRIIATFDDKIKKYMLLHQYFIRDGDVLEVKDFQPNTGIEIYEVIRVKDGVPLFMEDHLKRFYHSAWICHLEIPVKGREILSMLKLLIERNGEKEGNIRFSYCFRPKGVFHAYFIPHYYPGREMIETGVFCGLLQAERNNPNAKTVQTGLREIADKMIREQGLFEAILINQKGEITEGSRSNLFFLKNGIFMTSPAEDVLPGITRQKVLEIISVTGMEVVIKGISIQELAGADGAFLTGTSPKVLPIRKIGDYPFSVGLPEINQLVKDYDDLIGKYIKNNR